MIDYNKIVAWMPHSSTFLPLVKTWGNKALIKDSEKYTDLYVDKLFDFIYCVQGENIVQIKKPSV